MGLPSNLRLTVSIVVFDTPWEVFVETYSSLFRAVERVNISAPELFTQVIIVNNNIDEELQLPERSFSSRQSDTPEVQLIQGHGNIGYSRGHNLALERAESDYFLILNPDVKLDDQCLIVGLEYLEKNPDVSMVSPMAFDPFGKRQFLCRRFPTILDLFLRSFAPNTMKDKFRARLHHYEMRGLDDEGATKSIPIISGCFMLMRSEIFKTVAGFDNSYFMYFEDYDLSLRIRAIGNIAYLPHMKIVHAGGGASKKGQRHIFYFIRSAIKFCFKHGFYLWRRPKI